MISHPSSSPNQDWNLLVLSDLHLGEQRAGEDRTYVKERSDFLANHFSSFLKHYTSHRENDLPWKLVIAGDMLDFMRVHVPNQPNVESEASQDWEIPPHDLEGALQKLEQIFVLHHESFQALVDFLLEDNQVILITGNHDAELDWPEVQVNLRIELFKLAQAKQPDLCQERFDSLTTFQPWFYYEPNQLYIEHGHLHDRWCTIDQLFEPESEATSKQLRSPIHIASEHQNKVQEAMENFPMEEVDKLGPKVFYRWFADLPRSKKSQVLRQTFMVIYRLLGIAFKRSIVQARNSSRSTFHQAHEKEHFPRLQETTVTPLYDSFFSMMQALYMDRLLLIIITSSLMTFFLVAPWSAQLRALCMTLTSIGAVAAFNFLTKTHPSSETAPAMFAAAMRVASRMNAPLIIFGHSHRFERRWLNDKQLYINLGSWAAPLKEPETFIHSTPMHPKDEEGLDFSQSYLVLKKDKKGYALTVKLWDAHTGPHPYQEEASIPSACFDSSASHAAMLNLNCLS